MIAKRQRIPLIDKNALAIGLPIHVEKPSAWFRSKAHRHWIGTLNCACCGRAAMCDPAHIRVGTDGCGGEKPSDIFVVPLAPFCHRRQHNMSEWEFWRQVNVGDPGLWAVRKYALASPDPKTREAAGRWLETGKVLP